MQARQHTAPVLVERGEARPLGPVSLGDREVDEAWLQALLFEHPGLIPAAEIEPIFDELIPLARELPTPAGFVDLVYITPKGFIALAETKLWRNPEARRSVVAQVIDYAKELSRWSYDDLNAAVVRARGGGGGDPLKEAASSVEEDFSEARFVDTVARNLRLGRFLLLLIGDGIREEVEHMADFLQQTPQLHFTLALVEMALYHLDQEGNERLLVAPRIVARTREVTRAVVEIRTPVRPEDVEVTLPLPEKVGPAKITEDEFLRELAKITDAEVVEFARWVLEEVSKHELLEIAWGEAGPMIEWTDDHTGHRFLFGQLQVKTGRLASTQRVIPWFRKAGVNLDIGREYLDELAELIPGAKCIRRRAASGRSEWELISMSERGAWRKDAPPLKLLAPRGEQWMQLIERTVDRLRDELANN